MKQAYEGLTLAGTLYYDMLCAFKYKHEGDTVWKLRGMMDLGKFNKEYGYPVPNCSPASEWDEYNKAYNYLKDNGYIRSEFYSRPAGRGCVSWYWRFEPVLWGDKLAIADKYIAAMNKAKEGN